MYKLIVLVGHNYCFSYCSLEKFCSEGIPLLKTLVQSRHLKAAIHVLENILPMAYHCPFYLLKNEQLGSIHFIVLEIFHTSVSFVSFANKPNVTKNCQKVQRASRVVLP